MSNLRVIAAADLGRQAWVDHGDGSPLAVPSADSFDPIQRSTRPSVKPCHRDGRAGGLWTSTFDERYGSDWIQWCLSESFRCESADAKWHTWVLTPIPEARILEINSYADLEDLVAAYPQTEHFSATRYGSEWSETRPAWDEIAADYDAVHLTEAGQWDTRLSMPLDLYGWDCECTLWLRWVFAAVEDLGVRAYATRPWDEDEESSVIAAGEAV